MRRVSLTGRVSVLAVLVAMAIGVMFAAALVAIVSLRRAEASETRSKDVTVATLRLQTLAVDLESSVRGYALSADPRFLALFRQARAQVPDALASLERLVADDPPQLTRAHRARRQLDGYLTDYAANVITIAQISRPAARGPAAGNEGKRRTQELRATLRTVLGVEEQRSRQRAAHARSVARSAVAVGSCATAVSAILVLLFGAWVSRAVAWPVRRAASAAAAVAGGDLDVRLEEEGAGEVAALMGAFNSMTRSLEVGRRELLLQNEQLRESERHKRDLIAMVSHEVRTPLAAVLGFTTLLLERDFAPDEQRRYLEIVDQQARRLASLAGDFLDVQLLEGGGITLVRSEFDLCELAREQAQLFFEHPDDHRLVLDLPDAPVVVNADRDRLAQVVGNLLSNAIKYAPDGGEVRLGVEHGGSTATLSVSDEGLGIASDDRERVFEKFYRGSDAATVTAGTGLGLAVAREIVESHGGAIAVASAEGEGSTFTVTLPV